eukprot:4011443-Pleurochrysis_carterae.AAC.1
MDVVRASTVDNETYVFALRAKAARVPIAVSVRTRRDQHARVRGYAKINMRPYISVERFGRRWFAHGRCHWPDISAAIYSWMFLAAGRVRVQRVWFASQKITRVEKRGFSTIRAIRVRDRAPGQRGMSHVQCPEYACSREVPDS